MADLAFDDGTARRAARAAARAEGFAAWRLSAPAVLLLAVLILGTLNNGLTLLDVSSFWQDVTRGIVLLLAVSLDQIRSRAAGD